MQTNEEKVHTTLNLSLRLIHQADQLFKDKTRTQIIHEALERMIRMERLERHVLKWKGKGRFKTHG